VPVTSTVEDALPGLNKQNRAAVGRLMTHGGLGYAEEAADGRMHGEIRIVPNELIYSPSVLVMPHGGGIDLDLYNDDANNHCAILPSNGDLQWIWFPVYSKATATLELDGPGIYWYGSAIGNNEGRGLTGAIVVLGDVPEHARLARPAQPRP
jgi:PQQ system protein